MTNGVRNSIGFFLQQENNCDNIEIKNTKIHFMIFIFLYL